MQSSCLCRIRCLILSNRLWLVQHVIAAQLLGQMFHITLALDQLEVERRHARPETSVLVPGYVKGDLKISMIIPQFFALYRLKVWVLVGLRRTRPGIVAAEAARLLFLLLCLCG
jgi:hypothetical protein